MRKMPIKDVSASQIFDSRGNPTIEVTAILDDGSIGTSKVPSGASTGTYEAYELRDGDYQIFNGLGVSKAVDNVNKKKFKAIVGEDA